ncbi:zinc finger domain-containing protein [Embleya scabrispora]
MDEVEAVDLVRWVQALCPQQHIDRLTGEAWFEVLEPFDFEECKAAATVCAREKPFVAPAEIIAEVRRVHAERLASLVLYEPAPGEDVEGYLERLRAQIAAVASGRSVPEIARASGPRLQLVSGGAGLRALPPEVEAVVGGLRHPARSVRCPLCGAREGFSCHYSDRRVVPTGAHAERVAVWAVQRVVCPACSAVPGTPCRRSPDESLRQPAHSERVQVAEREAA